MAKNYRGRVLFLYPNCEGYGGVPNGIALLSGCLKAAGFDTRCFDTTFLKSKPLDHLERQKYGGVDKSDAALAWGEWTPDLAARIPDLLVQTIADYQPDLLAVSFVEMDYLYGISLVEKVKEKFSLPVIAGGIFTTLCPDSVISHDSIDLVCVGEGEEALVELAECLVAKRDYRHIRNLWVKADGQIFQNPLRPLKDLDTLPFQDWSIFDERHFYKPYMGGFYRTGFFEMNRGCHFNCTYCCNAYLKKLYQGLGKYIRHRNIDLTLDEIAYFKEKYQLELVFFIDDDFLAIPEERFNYFCQEYHRRIGLPFYIQTRCETIREDYIRKLKEINVSTIALGVEHGDEGYRKQYMLRKMSNAQLQQAFDIIHKYDIRTTANVIMAVPHEDEKTFQNTVRLLKQLQPKSVSISFFQPFHGTRMRDMAVQEGYISEAHIISDSTQCLNMPQFPQERIRHYYENFRKYLNGEMELEEVP
jgi:anaerobic magnesium-protoporphyrin IX monomethyl ester cyclase